MLVLPLGLALTALLLRSVVRWRHSHAPDLGAMSDRWVAAYNASSRASFF